MHAKLKSLIPKPYDFEPKTLGEHLRKRRLILGLTQTEVAKLFNTSLETILNWEKGYKKPKIFQIPILIDFLGYDPINSTPTSIAELLKSKRQKLGWTQKMAAKKLGVDPSTWSSWECGGTIMSHKHRRLVASFLDMDEKIVDEIMRKQWNEKHV